MTSTTEIPYHTSSFCNHYSIIPSRLAGKSFLLPGDGDKKLKICLQVFSSSTQLRNRSLRIGYWTIALLASIISSFESFDLAVLYVCVALTKSCTLWNNGTLLFSVLKLKIGKVCPYARAYQLTVCLNKKLLN